MTDKIIILITAGSSEEAGKIARSLVEQKLAACVNLIDPIRSVYRWEGKVTEDGEALLIVKSSRELFDEVQRVVEQMHSYQVPELICLPIIDGSPNYLNWLTESLKSPGSEPNSTLEFPGEKAGKPAKPGGKAKPKRKLD